MLRKSWLILSTILLLGPNAAVAEEFTGTLKKVKESGEIAIGYRDASIPFSYLDGDQKPIGFAMDICYAITDVVKAELKLPKLAVKLVPVTASTRIPLMANGTIDLECGSTTNNVDRQKQVWFTNTHFLTATRFASKNSAQIDKIDDLKGKTVVSIPGSTNIVQTLEINTARSLGMTVLQAKDHGEAWLMVENGRAAAYVMDDVLLASLIASSKEPDAYRISSDALSRPEPYGIMVRKDDPAFKKVADVATAKLYVSPEGKALYDKWFTKPIPPRGINLNFPINASMIKTMMHPSDSPDPAMY
ncbi:amino acid ABC transporter substrate-binding protein [Methylobacterium sp. E-065]|uniref:amino acid ABC transporter substrate-binding protein n=1 Tax=Methylobacterium sp. E-065 TaxID=2836583 RepID=UPI001FBBED08|nr:amino acid ABC transporter substrate-binding protein [Methylobacterium sp. E-065]MCJ2017787.1 amino acid ABC transporter substrate-binding protein [Methylobacterium sp. E-065]